MGWPFRKSEPEDDPKLVSAENHVAQLQLRGYYVHRTLSERDERNHWSEAVYELWRGGDPA